MRRFSLDLNLKSFVLGSVAVKQFDIFLSWIYIFYVPFPCHTCLYEIVNLNEWISLLHDFK